MSTVININVWIFGTILLTQPLKIVFWEVTQALGHRCSIGGV
jgi:hypothetical protein